MGKALLSGSDYAIFTSDNPRSEDPQRIMDEMLGSDSILDEKAAVIEIDRRSAIVKAVAEAQDGDCVLVLGKGHEKGQEVAGVKYPFDDRLELARAIEGLS
jgi:UDP-N-acetylmuramoyl-L-alanyl-D-glutamate--2,6-diaminopimelate ligase